MINGEAGRWPHEVELSYPYTLVKGLYYARKASMSPVYAVEGGYMAQDQKLEDDIGLIAQLALWAKAHAKVLYEKRKKKR